MRPFNLALACLVFVTSASAGGVITLKNSCSFGVWQWTFGFGSSVPKNIINSGGTSPINYEDGEASMNAKLFIGDSSDQPVQIEWSTHDGRIWYDISFINGNPFGVNITPQQNIGGSCKTRSCRGGKGCGEAYNVPTDDMQAMADCPMGTGLMVELCPSGNVKREDGPAGMIGRSFMA